jgi:hypothetical protein
MAFQNVLRQIKKIIYRLKRQYGVVMYITYTNSADEYNLETGQITRDLTSIKVRRGIVLPNRLAKDFEYDLSFIAANKNFTYGGIFEKGERNIVIDADDLPSGFQITTEMYVVYSNRRYEIKDATLAEENKAWLLRIKEVSNTDNFDPTA